MDELILFSLGFLSQNSLGSSLYFVGIRVFIVVCEECEKSVFIQTRHSGDSTSQLIAWLDYLFCLVVLQLS